MSSEIFLPYGPMLMKMKQIQKKKNNIENFTILWTTLVETLPNICMNFEGWICCVLSEMSFEISLLYGSMLTKAEKNRKKEKN